VGVIFFRGEPQREKIMEKEYIFLLAEEGYIEVEQRKNGEDNTDNRIHQSGGSSLKDYPATFFMLF
jgi:hypothetical protein